MSKLAQLTKQVIVHVRNRKVLLGSMYPEKMSQTFPGSVINALQVGLPRTFKDLIRYFKTPDSSMKALASDLEEANRGIDAESSIETGTKAPITSKNSQTNNAPLRRSRRSSSRFSQPSTQSEQQLETKVVKESGNISLVSKPVKIQGRSKKLDKKTTKDMPAVPKSRTSSKPNSKKARAKTVSKLKSAVSTSKKQSRSSSVPKGRRNLPDSGVDDLKPLNLSTPGVKRTRSGRVTTKPLQFWKSERIVSHLFEDKTFAFIPSQVEPSISSSLNPAKSRSRQKRGPGELKLKSINKAKRLRKSAPQQDIKRNSSNQQSSSSQTRPVKKAAVKAKEKEASIQQALSSKAGSRPRNVVWTDDESNLLRSVHAVIDPRDKHFWSRVAEFFPGKSDRECQRQFESLFPTPQPKPGSRSRRNRPPGIRSS